MTTNRTLDATPDARLNDLYWNSDRTVEQILDELSVGRGSLYASISPILAGILCSTCGDPVVFTNRTNRSSGSGTCVACGIHVEVAAEAAAGNNGPARHSDPATEPESPGEMAGWSRWSAELRAVERERAALIGGAAALGLVLGTLATRVFRG